MAQAETSPSAVRATAPADAVSHADMANAIRVLAMDAVEKAKSGHPGMPMGMADVATVLFTRFMNLDPLHPDWADRDRFVLSAGHGSMLLYAVLHLLGYEQMTMEQIESFRQLGSKTAGHPEYGAAPGIETTTGPLGQGLATAAGMALAERIMADRFGRDLVDHYTYVIASDGDLMEGISHEAISLAGHLGLSKLIVLFDDNNISIDGSLDLSESSDQLARFEAAGWDAVRIDGHNPEEIAQAIEAARSSNRPSLVACRTTIAYGAPTKAGTSAAHGAALGETEIAGAREAYGWTAEPFAVPSKILDAWRLAGLKSAKARSAWDRRLEAADEATRKGFADRISGDMPEAIDEAISAFKKQISSDRPAWATRKASGETLNAILPVAPAMIGGSADLTGSNNTRGADQAEIKPGDFSGSYVHYGVREHAMGAMMNGMALHGGIIPYAGTFLVFADYSRPAIRLAALMGLRVIHVLTHDSIGVGEDGPTHQPVEHLAALRAIPNLAVYRPADPVEVAESWQHALQSTKTPSALVLTRQGLPTVRTTHTDENLTAKGAYELASANGSAKVTLIATGSEVQLAMEARDRLHAEGIGTRVVSMPCRENFEAQGAAYIHETLGPGTVKVAVEAAVRFGWDGLVGLDGGFVGMTGFGESAPAGQLYEHFGITSDAIVEQVKARLASNGK